MAGLAKRDRARAIAIGVGAAALIRMALSVVAVRMLAVIGLTLAGGLLLLWVCWKMYRELRQPPRMRVLPAAKLYARPLCRSRSPTCP